MVLCYVSVWKAKCCKCLSQPSYFPFQEAETTKLLLVLVEMCLTSEVFAVRESVLLKPVV